MDVDLRGLRVTVMGLGRFGGGAGVARWLAEQEAQVVATDLLSAERLADVLEPLAGHVARGSIELHLGGHIEADFTACDLVVANPGPTVKDAADNWHANPPNYPGGTIDVMDVRIGRHLPQGKTPNLNSPLGTPGPRRAA